MGLLYKDELLDTFGAWPLAYIPYGGPDFGEIAAVAKASATAATKRSMQRWVAAGDRSVEAGARRRAGAAAGRARASFSCRASAFYGASLHPLFGAPVDPRLVAAFRKEVEAFDNGLALFDPPIKPRADPVRGRLDARLFHSGGRLRRRAPADDHLHQRLRRHDRRHVLRLSGGGEPSRLSQPAVRRAGAGRDAVRAQHSAAAGLGDGRSARSSTSR